MHLFFPWFQRWKSYYFLLFFVSASVLILALFLVFRSEKEKPLVVVITSYNNSQWYKRNLASIFNQKYSNYRVIYRDDCSKDGTYDLVKSYVKQCVQEHRVTVIKSDRRQGALANLYSVIHECDNHEIILTVDGDDWLKNDQVFARIDCAYDDPNVWLTYGQYEVYPKGDLGICRPMPELVVKTAAYRQFPWITSQLRTFYASLFKKIRKEDLQLDDNFFTVTWDQAFMYPMLEMASGRIKFISNVLYVYNQATEFNDFKVRLDQVLACERIVRQRKKYQPLKVLT